MNSYNIQIEDMQQILTSYLKKGKIEPEKIEEKINLLEGALKKEQFVILCKPIPDEIQNIVFNALRNLRVIVIEMREQLRTALERKENPTTAERCIAIIPFISNLSTNVDEFNKGKDGSNIEDISRNIRILRKKARQYFLLPSLQKEMEEVDLSKDEIKNFFDGLTQNIEIEMEEL